MKDWCFIVVLLVFAIELFSCTAAGPFYECRLGSEERYQVNLCVDRCPEVGSQRGCTGNRTCCLVGCARICFHERRSGLSSQIETLPVTAPSNAPTAMQHFIRQGDDVQTTVMAVDNNNVTDPVTNASLISTDTPTPAVNSSSSNETAEFLLPIMTNELTSSAVSSPSTEGSGASTVTEATTTTTGAVPAAAPPAVTPDDLISPIQALGKLRFSSLDKPFSKEDEKVLQSVMKTPQQWNGVTDNVVSSLDDAQHVVTSSKGADSALMWQIFEFLRIIQSKLDVISSNGINAGNAAMSNGGPDSPPRSKPALSPTDPNIVIRKSLSEFSKTLNKVQSELVSLTAGQQQVVRILERVFVNQLRLANGAAAFVAATANTINTRRQQRWQQERLPTSPNPLNQLMPLAEAILLDNAALFSSDVMSSCYRLNGCSFDVCRLTKCEKYPTAMCRINSCRNCSAEFFVGNSRVQCN